MGRKKKFIDKKESSTFHVVHRSQQDKAAAGEEGASEFVLIPSGPSREQREAQAVGDAGGAGKNASLGELQDHVNSLGLPNDGYDYEQHLKSMGGGTFVSRSGKVQHFAEGNAGARGGARATIPEEALPSEEMLDRQLEAVTISERVMDGDMRRALAAGLAGVGEDSDDEGNMLDDDFVVQAAGAGDDGGFDFDAHVARLMEASARETGLRQRTKDDDLQTKGLSRLRREGDEDSDSDSDGGRSIADSNASSGEFDEALLEGLDLNGGAGVGAGVAEDRTMLDSQFEATLAAYDSDEWGELDEDDNRVQGQWDVQQHEYANTCLDDFLATKEDAAWADGVERLPPEQRAIAVATLAVDGGHGSGNPIEPPTPTVALVTGPANDASAGGDDEGGPVGLSAGKGVAASEAGGGGASSAGPRLGTLRGLGGGVVKEEEEEEGADEFDIEHHNEYLRDEQVDKWDCETIVSTYSNIDNHPSVLGTGRKPKPRRPRGPPAAVTAGERGEGAADGSLVEQVTLSEKTGLPLGVLPERTFSDKGMVSLTAGRNVGERRDPEETAEDKRQRKAQIKQDKKDKRVQKKSVKVAFTSEAKIVAHALANPEAPQNRSVFSYS